MQNRRGLASWIIACLALLIAGCATIPSVTQPTPPAGMTGFFHKVERKETLWRISKKYGLELDELVKINRISDASSIEIGQMIFIPKTKKKEPAVTRPVAGEDFIWPIRGKVIKSFGQAYDNMINRGVNIQPWKHEEVAAARSGKIVFLNKDFLSFGKTIIIDHGDGFLTVYARNADVYVNLGDYVSRGTAIAKVGPMGKNNETYLHFEIRKGSSAQNPNFYLAN